MVYQEKALHNYFIPCHRKYSDQHNRDIYTYAAHDGKVGSKTIKYTSAFLYSDWLYFQWHGRKINIVLSQWLACYNNYSMCILFTRNLCCFATMCTLQCISYKLFCNIVAFIIQCNNLSEKNSFPDHHANR